MPKVLRQHFELTAVPLGLKHAHAKPQLTDTNTDAKRMFGWSRKYSYADLEQNRPKFAGYIPAVIGTPEELLATTGE